MVIYLISGLAGMIICGVISRSINENKGYEGGFWWGFFLGVIGIIVVACKTDKRVLDAAASSYHNTSVWICPKCGHENPTNERYCGSCATERYAKIQPEQTWTCDKCNEKNPYNNRFCSKCGQEHSSKWKCEFCGTINSVSSAFCGQCGNKKPEVRMSPDNEIKYVTEYIGDDRLRCPYCGTEQRKKRTLCYKCSKELIQK